MPGDEERLDPLEAAALIQTSTAQARRSMQVRTPLLYASWGMAWLFGLGAMWASVRGQTPYRGPSTAASVALAVLILAALVITMVVVIRATRGIQGVSAVQGRMYGLSWPIGFTALNAIQGALARNGASDTVLGLFGAAGPLLVTSLIYLLSAAIWLDWPMFVMGAWLAVVIAAGVWTGPVTLLLVEAVAGGGGFLLMAGYVAVRARR